METVKTPSRWRFALKMAGCHLLVSLFLAGMAALLVFKVWYPYPYAELTGGLQLYKLVVAVDVVCGPLLTLVLASPKKSVRERVVDFSLVGVIQLAALLYGLYSVSLARPVAVAFEVDRFSVVTAAEVDDTLLADAPEGLRRLPWFGVNRVGIREPLNAEEYNQDLMLSLKGIEPSMRPNRWAADDAREREKIRQGMKPLSALAAMRNMTEADILREADVKDTGEKRYYLPFTGSKEKGWVAVLDDHADFLGFAKIDGFAKADK